jgi:DNA-binding NtrC family response regulator
VEMFQAPGERLLNDLENKIVAEAFEFTGRNQVRTAALLGISRNVLRTLLRKHGLLIFRRRKTRGGAVSM